MTATQETAYLPPHSIEAEKSVIGAALVDPQCVPEAASIIRAPEAFYRHQHEVIWRAILALSAKGHEIDYVTVSEQVISAGEIESCNGGDALHAYLAEVSQGVPSSFGMKRYAEIVRDRALLREIVQRAARIRDAALTPGADARQVMDQLVTDAMELSLQRASGEPRHIRAIGDKVRERAEAGGIVGLESGWRDLDLITTGWKPGQLVVIGARPGQGKSSFAAAVALKHRDSGVLLFSLEMDGEEIYPRMVAMHAGVDASAYSRGRLPAKDLFTARQSEAELDRSAIWFDDAPKQSVQDIRAQARRWSLKHGLALIIVDYLGLVDATDRTVQRYEQLGEITRSLKQLARELRVPVMAPHQLSRAAETREPTLADLRESGNIEQDADQVIFIHKTGTGINGMTPVDVIVAKHRQGPTGKVAMHFRRACTRFEERARE